MFRRKRELEEELGPALDGHDQLARLERFLTVAEPEPEEEPIEREEPIVDEPPILLVFGDCGPAMATCRLARECGFRIEVAWRQPADTGQPLSLDAGAGGDAAASSPETIRSLADRICAIGQDADIARACGIDRNHYICIFEQDEEVCEQLALACLATEAAYLGIWCDSARADILFENLKDAGAPDAELAAVCCPAGLGIGARTDEQEAVAIVAELLAARTGALKRLR